MADSLVCQICMEDIRKPIMCKACSMIYCEKCIQDWLMRKEKSCPNCRVDILDDSGLLKKIHWFNEYKDRLTKTPKIDENDCRKHERKLNLYCENCEKCICDFCLEEKIHSGHESETIGSFFLSLKMKFDDYLEVLIEHLAFIDQKFDGLAVVAKSVNKRKRIILEDIKKMNTIHSPQNIRKLTADSVKELDLNLDSIAHEKNETIAFQKEIQTYIAKLEENLNGNNQINFIKIAAGLESEFEELEARIDKDVDFIKQFTINPELEGTLSIPNISRYLAKEMEFFKFSCSAPKQFQNIVFHVVLSTHAKNNEIMFIYGQSDLEYVDRSVDIKIYSDNKETFYKAEMQIGKQPAVVKFPDLCNKINILQQDCTLNFSFQVLEVCNHEEDSDDSNLSGDMDILLFKFVKAGKKTISIEPSVFRVNLESGVWWIKLFINKGIIEANLTLLEGCPQRFACNLQIQSIDNLMEDYFNCFDERTFHQIAKLSGLDMDYEYNMILEITSLTLNELHPLEPKYKSIEIPLELKDKSKIISRVLYDEHAFLWCFTLKTTKDGHILTALLKMGTPGSFDFYYGYKTEIDGKSRKLYGCTTKITEIDTVDTEFELPLDKIETDEGKVTSVFVCVRAGSLESKLFYKYQ